MRERKKERKEKEKKNLTRDDFDRSENKEREDGKTHRDQTM
jgi:hypothetical protein